MLEDLGLIGVNQVQAAVQLPNGDGNRDNVPLLDTNDEDPVATTADKKDKKKSSIGHPVTREDALFRIIGIGRSGLSDISENKHKHLANAYSPSEP